MSDGTRRDWVDAVKRVVVKIGSRSLVDERNRLEEGAVRELVRQVAAVRAAGRSVVLVSSGAIAAGLPDLGLQKRPRDLPSLQAAAALGQARLIELYRELFAEQGLAAAQMLLTHADMDQRERHLNARNTLHRLLEAGALPIVNENDTVAVEEIRVGDNDRLSAMVAALAQADLLILLTGVEGLFDAPPERGGRLVPLVREITPEVRAMAGGAGSDVGAGGMRTKLDAAEMAMRSGERMIIAAARERDVLPRLLAGEPIGTVFAPRPERMRGRERWIAFFQKTKGTLAVDAGAVSAVQEKGRSLLPAGVIDVVGDFAPGDAVSVVDQTGIEIARGLVNYSSADLRRIARRKSAEIEGVLGRREYDEAIHRDNMVIV